MIRLHVFKGIGGHRAHALAVHQHVGDFEALVRGDGESLAAQPVHLDLTGGIDFSVLAGGSGDGILAGNQLEGGRDGVIRLHVFKGVGFHRAHALAVHQHIGDFGALVRGDGIGLGLPLVKRGLPIGGDTAVLARRRRDGQG